ncbi:MAG: hypothetical protein EPO24_10490 [Bacteroidetes bacterium]|nr:MAG: hypothetical protein EPO24_10490 [Bacteroidota bacterium]
MKTKKISNEPTVTITLTPQQYKNLVKTMYLGEWLINSWRMPDDTEKEIEAVEQVVYKHAGEAGLSDWIEYDDTLHLSFPTLDMEEELMPYIDDYNEENFWDDLLENLANRDFLWTYGEEKILAMTNEERLTLSSPFHERYHNEFTEHGIERLHIPFTVTQSTPNVRPS